MEEQIKGMLKQGVIQPSRSPWNWPIFLVPKKDGQFRPVLDFRKVNEVTEDDRYPLPAMSDLLMSLGNGNKFLVALISWVGTGKFQWHISFEKKKLLLTPLMDILSGNVTFQKMINTLFSDMLGIGEYAYLDDLLVYGKDVETHLADLWVVLLKLKNACLKA